MNNINDFVIEDGVLIKYTGTDAEATVPNSVHKIGKYAFKENDLLVSVVIPESVTTIEGYAFCRCNCLANIFIPNSVPEIGAYTFYECKSLKSIVIPESVTKIHKFAFDGSFALEKIVAMSTLSDVAFASLLYVHGDLKVFVAPQVSFETLKMSKMELVATIGYMLNQEQFVDQGLIHEYEKCISSQKKKILPLIFKDDVVECLTTYARLGKITVKNFDIDFLTPAQEANAAKCVSYLLDWKNKNLSQSKIDKQLEKQLAKDPFNATDMKKLWTFEEQGDGTLSITGYKGKETDICIPERIGKQQVTAIAADAFYPLKYGRRKDVGEQCKKITSISIPNTVTKIGVDAFRNCSSLANIIIPDSVTSIGKGFLCEDIFAGCTSLENIVVGDNNEIYKSVDGVLFSKDGKTLIRYAPKKVSMEYIVPESVNKIARYAFSNCSNVNSVVISNAVTHIDQQTFRDCESLKTVVIPKSVTIIDICAFAGCNSLESIDIPDSVTTINRNAFVECTKLKNVVIPKHITKIADYAFAKCYSLASISIPNSVIEISIYAFDMCAYLSDVYFAGNEEEWVKTGANDNYYLKRATIHYLSK